MHDCGLPGQVYSFPLSTKQSGSNGIDFWFHENGTASCTIGQFCVLYLEKGFQRDTRVKPILSSK